MLMDPEDKHELERDYGSASQMQGEYRQSMLARARKLAKKVIGSNLRLPTSSKLLEISASLKDEWCLEVGSGLKNGTARRINLDINLFPGVDVVGSGCRLPFADNSFAMARNLAVLEHVRDPQRMIQEIHRVLRPGGHVYVEVPFMQHFHAYPNDFQRYTIEGLKQAFSGFEVVESGVGIGPSSALTALIGDYFELLTFSRKRWVNDLVRTVPLILLWPLKFLDLLLVKNPRAHETASGIYMIGRKPA